MGEHKLNSAWFDAADKTALITGGGGIGAYMAIGLSDASADITPVGWRLDILEAVLAYRKRRIFAINLCLNGAATGLTKAVLNFVFPPDIIVSALGVNPRLHSDSIDEASWPETIHFNLNLPLLVVKAYAPQMKSWQMRLHRDFPKWRRIRAQLCLIKTVRRRHICYLYHGCNRCLHRSRSIFRKDKGDGPNGLPWR